MIFPTVPVWLETVLQCLQSSVQSQNAATFHMPATQALHHLPRTGFKGHSLITFYCLPPH